MEIKRVSELSEVLMNVLLLPYPQPRLRCENEYSHDGQPDNMFPCYSFTDVRQVVIGHNSEGEPDTVPMCKECRWRSRSGEYAEVQS